jgi:hypothetical protein
MSTPDPNQTLAEALLANAIANQVDNLTLDPEPAYLAVRFWREGRALILTKQAASLASVPDEVALAAPSVIWPGLSNLLKSMAGITLGIRGAELRGRIRTSYNGETWDFLTQFSPTQDGADERATLTLKRVDVN